MNQEQPIPEERNQSTVNSEQKAVTAQPKTLSKGWKRWLNYQAVVKQVPFFLFLALLAVIYIYNGHYADKLIRNINRTSKQVKELQYEYTDLKGKVMGQSKESELVKAVEPLGLKEWFGRPVVLKDTITN
jgi:hypothetical protein